MNTDTLSRRLRFAPPNPQVKHLVLTDSDYLIFEAINRHGPLPSNYLYEFTKHVRRDKTHLQNRLTEFYNGDSIGPYLIRPPQQFAGFVAHYQHLVYDLAPRARTALAERGTIVRYSPRRTEAFLHQLMQACVGASLELEASRKGLRYITREEILTHPKCPKATREAQNPLAIPAVVGDRKAVVPDDIFGIEYPGVGFRFFALEVDRNTESIERRDQGQTAFGKKIVGYLDILKRGTFTRHLGVSNLHVLTVTTNSTHAKNILDFIRKQKQPKYEGKFAFAVEPEFGSNWRVPKELLTKLINEPWETPVGEKRIGQP